MLTKTEIEFKIKNMAFAHHEYFFKGIIKRTEKAVLLWFGGDQKFWIPFRCISGDINRHSLNANINSKFLLSVLEKHFENKTWNDSKRLQARL